MSTINQLIYKISPACHGCDPGILSCYRCSADAHFHYFVCPQCCCRAALSASWINPVHPRVAEAPALTISVDDSPEFRPHHNIIQWRHFKVYHIDDCLISSSPAVRDLLTAWSHYCSFRSTTTVKKLDAVPILCIAPHLQSSPSMRKSRPWQCNPNALTLHISLHTCGRWPQQWLN